jgi:hypothetical protein
MFVLFRKLGTGVSNKTYTTADVECKDNNVLVGTTPGKITYCFFSLIE